MFAFSKVNRQMNKSNRSRPQKSKLFTRAKLVRSLLDVELIGLEYLWINKDFWLSYKEYTVDALAPEGDEGRGNLR